MTGESFQVEPVAHVVGGRIEPTDDYWGGTRSIIRIDSARFTPEATTGLEEFSHLDDLFQGVAGQPTKARASMIDVA
jgi:hypothetical protein